MTSAEERAAKLPLNGAKTYPLTRFGLAALRSFSQADIPAQELNPGLVHRLMREYLVEPYTGPSPYRTRKGPVAWLKITAAGRCALAASSPGDPTDG